MTDMAQAHGVTNDPVGRNGHIPAMKWPGYRLRMARTLESAMRAMRDNVRLFAEWILRHTVDEDSMSDHAPKPDRRSVTVDEFIRNPSSTMRSAEAAPVIVRDARGVACMTISVPTEKRHID